MDNDKRAALETAFTRLLGTRGDPVKGLPSAAWSDALAGVDRDVVLRAAVTAVRELLVPDWADKKRDDKRPQHALEAAEAWLADKSDEKVKAARVAAKACTAAKNETFGTDHRVAEAARACAWAAGSRDDTTHVYDAFALCEAELLARIALLSEYHRGAEQRRAIVDVLRRFVLPPEPKEEAPKPSFADAPPVPYSADSHFELGQRLVHKKFGDVVVTSVGETWIEVELPDASKKRLAHKPKP